MNFSTPCKLCGKTNGEHEAQSLNCPTKTGFSKKDKFQPETIPTLDGYTEDEYIKAAVDRISKAAEISTDHLSPWTMTAIHAELKTMVEIGKRICSGS